MEQRRMRGVVVDGEFVKSVASVMLLTGGVGTVLVACGSDGARTFTCVDERHVAVDPDRCDDGYRGGGVYFLNSYPGSTYYAPGTVVTGGDYVRSTDTAGRTRIGAAPNGRPSVGTVSRGGIGSGSGSSSGGGDSAGG